MKRLSLEDRAILISPVLFAVFTFCIPISPTLKSVFLWGAIGLVLFTPFYRHYLATSFNSIWGRTALILFLFIVIASLWSPAPYSLQASIITKYCKLIYLPVLAIGFMNPKTRVWSLNGFLIAMFFTAVLSILKAKGFFRMGDNLDPGEVFYNHIMTSFMIAYASYLSGLFALQNKGWFRIVYSLAFLLMSYQLLFINTGRTGTIIYCILIILLFIQKFSIKQAVAGASLFCLSIVLCYHLSSTMQVGVTNLVNEVKLFQKNKTETSLGYRIEFHQYAKSLFMEHPILGLGTGGFKFRFAQDNPVPKWGSILTEPHSQYWMTLAEQGVIGFALLIVFLGSLFFASLQLKETKPILQGLLIVFVIGCVSDTILCFSPVGYLFITISALCLGEFLEDTIAVSQHSKIGLPSTYAL